MYGSRQYIPLWCLSHFSFHEGASDPEELVEEAHRLGLRAIAITDRDGLYGIVKAHQKALELGIQLIIGADITLPDQSRILLLAKTHRGYRNLCRLISSGQLTHLKGQCRIPLETVLHHAEELIAIVPDSSSQNPRTGNEILSALKPVFHSDLFAMITRHKDATDRKRNHRMIATARNLDIAIVAGTRVLYHTRSRRPLQDLLTCIRNNVTIHNAARFIHPNDEHYLHTPSSFAALFDDIPNAVQVTMDIADRCRFSLREIDYRYPSETGSTGATSSERLRQLTLTGAAQRYGIPIPESISRQLQIEFALIDELGYAGYFLTMHDIVQFCRQQQILCQGRGSAANSAVCYCLGITAVDPLQMDLLFERFISRERAEPPDIDLDIEHRRREEVIQHVYQRYGRTHAAMVAVIVRYRPRSALRDVARALGIPDTDIARIAAHLSNGAAVNPDVVQSAGFSPIAPLYHHLCNGASQLLGFPRHLSIHPGGFLLGSDPVMDLVPVENTSMPRRTVIQWDKTDVESLGLFKVDLLGLGALTHLHLCFTLLSQTRHIHLDLSRIPADDPKTFDMICRGDTVGVFQLESRAQMAMLPRLRPRTFHDLVIEISIVRPGPITGDMVHPYLRRRSGDETVSYPHPDLEPILKKTLGIPLFQEQVMRIAMTVADYTPGEADQLRRDMGAWNTSGRMERHRKRLVSGMKRNGISEDFAIRVFEQIRGFGEYGFPESHAASFALISYASAYLRAHYPEEFTCALLNALPMGFYTESTIIEDARRHGIGCLPVDVTHSEHYCTIPAPGQIRMGLRHVNGLGISDFQQIDNARRQRAFNDMNDFSHRVRISSRLKSTLSCAGAFSTLIPNRREALWNALAPKPSGSPLLSTDPSIAQLAPVSPFDTVLWDYHTCGHSTRGHPLEHLRPQMDRMGLLSARQIIDLPDSSDVRCAGLVICRQRPATAAGVVFMTLEDESGFINVVCWKNTYEQHRPLARTESFLGVTGTVQNRDGATHLIVRHLWKPIFSQNPASIISRDFR